MSEIQYFGGSLDSKAAPFFGATVRAWQELNSARTALNKSGIQVPYIYIMAMEEALEVNYKSFTFPLRVWVSQDEDNIYTAPVHIKNAEAFRKMLADSGKKSTFIISRAPIEYDNSVAYLGYDGFVMKSSHRNFHYALSLDLRNLWKSLNLSNDLVLRLRWPNSPNGWTVDGLIDRSNTYVDEYFGKPPLEVSDKALEAFRLGFLNGYNRDLSEHIDYLHCNVPKLSHYRISENTTAARFQGFCLGQEARLQVGPAAISSGNESDKVKAFASLDADTIAKLQNLAFLHNAVIDRDREEISKRLDSFFGNSEYDSWSHISSFHSFASNYFDNLPKSAPNMNMWDNYNEKLEFDASLEFNLVDVVNFEKAQFRILQDSNDQLKIRFQTDSLSGSRTAVMSNGNKYKISDWKKTVELSFTVTNWSAEKRKALNGLTYNIKSQANTSKKYAPCMIKDNMIVAVEGEVEITSLDSLKKQVAAYFAAQH